MTAFLFPGQGSQRPGMGRDFFDSDSACSEIFERAQSVVGAGFLDTIFGDDAAALNDTRMAQPALLTVEVAIAEYLRRNGQVPSVCAGHSLGEIPALVVAGALAFEDALSFTVARARLMSEDVPEGGMAAVMGLAPDAIEAALPEGVQVANYNSPQQIIVSGSAASLDAAAEALKAAGAKRVLPLKVSGPFHSEHMRPAADELAKVLADTPIGAPATRFVSSVSGGVVADAEEIRVLLAAQLYSPVRWIDVMQQLDATNALEIGPGGVLKGLAKRIDGAPEVTAIATLEDAQAL